MHSIFEWGKGGSGENEYDNGGNLWKRRKNLRGDLYKKTNGAGLFPVGSFGEDS